MIRKYRSNKLAWDDHSLHSLNELKSKLTSKPILALPNHCLLFYLRTDACDNGLGAVILQDHSGTKMPVAYAIRKLLDSEQRYSTIEKECLAMVWAVEKFKNFIYAKEFVLQTDQ